MAIKKPRSLAVARTDNDLGVAVFVFVVRVDLVGRADPLQTAGQIPRSNRIQVRGRCRTKEDPAAKRLSTSPNVACAGAQRRSRQILRH